MYPRFKKIVKTKRPWSVLVVALGLLLTMNSCATISPETVKLSAEVGNRLSEMQHLHQVALQRYFDAEQEKVEHFLRNEWEPLFLKNYIGEAGIIEMLNNTSRFGDKEKNILSIALATYIDHADTLAMAVDSLVENINLAREDEPEKVKAALGIFLQADEVNGAAVHMSALLASEEPATLILEFAAAAHLEMNIQRRELIRPIEQARADAIGRLSVAYADLIKGQSAITGRLDAANKVRDEQGKVLGILGINETTESIMSKLSNFSTELDGSLKVAKEALNVNDPKDIASALNDKIADVFGQPQATKEAKNSPQQP